jgi:hypothetical protein
MEEALYAKQLNKALTVHPYLHVMYNGSVVVHRWTLVGRHVARERLSWCRAAIVARLRTRVPPTTATIIASTATATWLIASTASATIAASPSLVVAPPAALKATTHAASSTGREV